MSPRKSSTSSGKPPTRRPRYLGLVAHLDGPRFYSSREWDAWLRRRPLSDGRGSVPFRVVRSEGGRAIVEVDHLQVARALEVWLRPDPGDGTGAVQSVRTWGTLRKAKTWLAAPSVRDAE